MRKFLLTVVAMAAFTAPATAAVVYSNNFNAENGGNSQLNYNGFNGLSVTGGTVDLVKSGDFGITCAGGTGACVDLDGSTGNAGLTSSGSYTFNAGDRVALSFLFSGNQRGGANDGFATRFLFASAVSGTYGSESTNFGSQNYGSFTAQPGLFLTISGIVPSYAMTDFEFYFIASNAGSVNFNFEDLGNDNVGVVIDDVSLSIGAVPEPSAWALMILGFGAVGAAARRRAAGKAALT